MFRPETNWVFENTRTDFYRNLWTEKQLSFGEFLFVFLLCWFCFRFSLPLCALVNKCPPRYAPELSLGPGFDSLFRRVESWLCWQILPQCWSRFLGQPTSGVCVSPALQLLVWKAPLNKTGWNLYDRDIKTFQTTDRSESLLPACSWLDG